MLMLSSLLLLKLLGTLPDEGASFLGGGVAKTFWVQMGGGGRDAFGCARRLFPVLVRKTSASDSSLESGYICGNWCLDELPL